MNEPTDNGPTDRKELPLPSEEVARAILKLVRAQTMNYLADLTTPESSALVLEGYGIEYTPQCKLISRLSRVQQDALTRGTTVYALSAEGDAMGIKLMDAALSRRPV